MTKDIGRVAEATGLSQVEPQERLAASRFDPSRDVRQVFDDLRGQFGDWRANGVASILVHSKLPDEFGRKEWKDWFFRPAPTAFTWAREHGLIERRGRSKWAFTPLGDEAARYAQLLCDSDGSPKGGDACGSVHDSAGLQGIAPKVPS